MEDGAILQALTNILRDIFESPSLEFSPETRIEDVEKWDSFHHVNIIIAVEIQWGIKFKTVEMGRPQTVGEFIELIQRKLAQKKK